MRQLWVFLAAILAAVPCSRAQAPDELNEGSKVEWDSTNAIWRLKWWGQAGHTYFIRHNEDPREPWLWIPVIESGDDSIKEWGFTSTGDRFFVRFKYTDIPTTDPELADFDGDGIGNMAELLQGTDPLSAVDLDANGLPDDWEIYYFGETGQDPSGHSDDDGLTNLEEFYAGTDPTERDTDGDGVDDGTLRLKFEYDLVGRLEEAREGAGDSEGFGYDDGGNVEAGTGLRAGNP
ncbi:MAG: hypothetical protein IAE97_07445 [Chthoniobacterales bacterium]|nr:hypothetical protein [Chthoniobacterales bacterium]